MPHNDSGRRKALAEFRAIPIVLSGGTNILKLKGSFRTERDTKVYTIRGKQDFTVCAGDPYFRVEVYNAFYFMRTGTNLNRIFHLPIVPVGRIMNTAAMAVSREMFIGGFQRYKIWSYLKARCVGLGTLTNAEDLPPVALLQTIQLYGIVRTGTSAISAQDAFGIPMNAAIYDNAPPAQAKFIREHVRMAVTWLPRRQGRGCFHDHEIARRLISHAVIAGRFQGYTMAVTDRGISRLALWMREKAHGKSDQRLCGRCFF